MKLSTISRLCGAVVIATALVTTTPGSGDADADTPSAHDGPSAPSAPSDRESAGTGAPDAGKPASANSSGIGVDSTSRDGADPAEESPETGPTRPTRTADEESPAGGTASAPSDSEDEADPQPESSAESDAADRPPERNKTGTARTKANAVVTEPVTKATGAVAEVTKSPAGRPVTATSAITSTSPNTVSRAPMPSVSGSTLTASALPAESVTLTAPPSTALTPAGIVARLLTAVLAPFAGADQGGPSTALGQLLELIYVGRRQVGAVTNRVPIAAPVQRSQSVGSVITGGIGAADPDGDELTYRVSQEPTNGTVTLSGGSYTYTPSAALAATGGTDSFTVTVDDGIRSLFQFGGAAGPFSFFSLFGSTGRTSVPVTVTVTPVNSAVDTIAVGDGPQALASTPDGRRLYVANSNANTISVIDTATNAVIATINQDNGIGLYPSSLTASPDGTRIYVTNLYDGTLSAIDTDTNAVFATVRVGRAPGAAAVSPDGTRVYVANANDDTVSVIDAGNGATIATIDVGDSPAAIATSPDGTRVYVANALDGTVSAIDASTNTVFAVVSTGTTPEDLVVLPNGTLLYLSSSIDGAVTVLDTTTGAIVGSVYVGTDPEGLAVSPDGSRVYVTNAYDGTVSVIDTTTNSVIATIAAGIGPVAVAVSPGGTGVYVADFEGDAVSVISGLAAGPSPQADNLGAKGVTRPFRIYNLSQNPLTLSAFPGSDAATGPEVGSVLAPGDFAEYELTFFFFKNNFAPVQYVSDTGAVYNVLLEVEGFTERALVGCTANRPCESSDAIVQGIPGAFLLDVPGTVVEIPAGLGQQQADVLNGLCYEGSQASCDFTLSREEAALTAPHRVGATVTNTSFIASASTTVSIADTQGSSDSVTLGTKWAIKLSDAINFEINETYGHSWSSSHTFTQSVGVTLPPRSFGYVEAQQPLFRDYGDFTVVLGNTTFILRDVYFDTPNPDDSLSQYTVFVEALPDPLNP